MLENSLTAGRKSCNLNFSTVQKMIHRLLTQDRIKTGLNEGRVTNNHGSYDHKPVVVKIKAYTKKELAKKLDMSLEELEKLKSPNFYHHMVNKVSLPLIRLYCATKFVNSEYKGE